MVASFMTVLEHLDDLDDMWELPETKQEPIGACMINCVACVQYTSVYPMFVFVKTAQTSMSASNLQPVMAKRR